jgi:hypothetical protein
MLRSLVAAAVFGAGTSLSSAATAQIFPPAPEAPPSSEPRWDPSQPPPPGYHVERKINRGLVIAGSVVFGAAYVSIVVPTFLIQVGGTQPRTGGFTTMPLPGAPAAILPVAGTLVLMVPLIQGAGGENPNGELIGLCVLDALVQAAGAGMLIGGLVGKSVLVPGPARARTSYVLPTPIRYGDRGAGLGLSGAF